MDFPQEQTLMTKYQPLTAAVIQDDNSAAYVSNCRQEIKDEIKGVEAIRVSLKEPILEAGRRIDQQAKKIIAPLEAIVRMIDGKLLTWHKSQEEIRRKIAEDQKAEFLAELEAEKQAQLVTVMLTEDAKAAEAVAEIEKHQERLEAAPIVVEHKIRTMEATTYVQKRWTFSVIDESQIPLEYLMVNETKLGKYAREMKEKASVPGVKFFQTESIGGSR